MNVIEGLLKIRFYLYGCTSKISEFSSEKLFLLLLLQTCKISEFSSEKLFLLLLLQTCKISEFSSEKLSLLLLLQTSHNLPSFIYIVFYVD